LPSEESPTPSPDASYTPSPDASYTPSPDASYTPSPYASYTPSPDASYTPSPDASYTPSPYASYTPSPDASYTPSPDASYTPSPYASYTPSPDTPSPTPGVQRIYDLARFINELFINNKDITFEEYLNVVVNRTNFPELYNLKLKLSDYNVFSFFSTLAKINMLDETKIFVKLTEE